MDYIDWEVIRKWTETIALILVAMLAFVQERIRIWWGRTTLQLNIKTNIPSRTTWGGDEDKPVFFLLMELKNLNEARPAKRTRVLLTQLFKKNSNGRYIRYNVDSPLQMLWSPAELHDKDPFPTIVKPRTVDLGNVSRGDRSGFVIGGRILPYNFQGFLNPKLNLPETHYALYGFEFDSENCKPKKPEYIEVYWNGVWEDAPEKMSKNLYAKKLPESEIDFD